jgi:hypothetical protein
MQSIISSTSDRLGFDIVISSTRCMSGTVGA